MASTASDVRRQATAAGAADRCPWCGQPISHSLFERIRTRIAAEERERAALLERRLREELAKERAQTRKALEKAHAQALALERERSAAEMLKLEKRLERLQAQLKGKVDDGSAEGASIDLLEELKREFPQDDIKPVRGRKEGADILHRVVEEGQECGRIVYGSKRRRAWRNDYLTSLRADQLAAHAEHAILATQALPAGARQLHLQDGVIALNPARAVLVASVLRKHIVQLHGMRLSGVARADKANQVYAFITSDRFSQLLAQIETGAQRLLELDVKEKAAHDANWERRGQLIRSVERGRGELKVELDRLIGATTTVRVVDRR
jgi:hypothetical protein